MRLTLRAARRLCSPAPSYPLGPKGLTFDDAYFPAGALCRARQYRGNVFLDDKPGVCVYVYHLVGPLPVFSQGWQIIFEANIYPM